MKMAKAESSLRSEPQFFVNQKKGELKELTKLLGQYHLEKDIGKQRQTIKKVIACMTLGIDVSQLFAEMVKASKTSDAIVKKMVYLYLVNYSENSQECVILAINTFLADCRDSDFKVRALALRTLSSLKFSDAIPYTERAVKEGLKDVHPYVRKTACIACIKLHKDSLASASNGEYIEELYKLIKDADPQVSINAFIALDEILESEGGIAITRKLVVHLLNRLKEYPEWAQSLVINLLARYEPKEKERIDILNILEDKLLHADAGVILAAIKVFMKYTKDDSRLNMQVMQRLQAPLITLMTAGETAGNREITYVVLQHILLIVSKYGKGESNYHLFKNDHKHFFCKTEEQSYIKDVKIEIMSYIACDLNMRDIINELSEYATDVDPDFAKKSISCMGKIALRNPKMAKAIADNLLRFFKYRIEHISSECITVFSILLRKYPSLADTLIPLVPSLHPLLVKTEAKCALIWVMGEFGERIAEAPYVLEYYAGAEMSEVQVLHSLLNAVLKLFFKRPRECQVILGKLLKQLILHSDNSDLRDRATMYYNLLASNVEAAKEILMGKEKEQPITNFWEDEVAEDKAKIEKEFNTFSVIYNEPQEKFLKKDLVLEAYQQERQEELKQSKTKENAKEEREDLLTPENKTHPAPNNKDLLVS